MLSKSWPQFLRQTRVSTPVPLLDFRQFLEKTYPRWAAVCGCSSCGVFTVRSPAVVPPAGLGLVMDINLFAILAICGLFCVWRIHAYVRQRTKQELLRERVAWMLWLAADRVQMQ